jgi:hypothetical protein
MGKASSAKKVARAARVGGKAGKTRSLASLFSLLIGGVVVAGILLIVLSRGGTGAVVAPKLGDHWHAAYGIYDCDHFIPNLVDQVQDTTGLHTHGDGLMHMHPFGTKYTGTGANIGHWGETTGLDVTDTSIKATGIDKTNGDKCGDKPGTLKLKVWNSTTDTKGHLIPKNYAKYNPQEFTMWVLAFVPEGTDIPQPPADAIQALQSPADVTGATPSTPPVTATGSIPPSGAPLTTDTSAPGDTTPSTAPNTTVATTSP